MSFVDSFKNNLNNIQEETFLTYALELFDYQFTTNEVYRQYCSFLKKSPRNIKELQDIPFLPISLYKNQTIKSGKWKEEYVFKSSGTTNASRSFQYVRDLAFYKRISNVIFESFYPHFEKSHILGLLPSYQIQGNSSLIFMVDHLMNSTTKKSYYFLDKMEELAEFLKVEKNTPKILFGVSYALLDFAQLFPDEYQNLTVIETGGMKGRKKEMVRNELHDELKRGFKSIDHIHSEYGMTELTSQAYSQGNGNFQPPKWMKVMIRDINDPFSYLDIFKTGGVNIIDLANVDTCAFIETMDLGEMIDKQSFRILGRFDNSEIRGCNLLISQV